MEAHKRHVIAARLIAADCVAESTCNKYVTLFQKWRNYASRVGVGCWKATSDDVIAYLCQMGPNCSSSTAYQHLSAISYMYKLKRLPSPTLDPIVGMYMKGLRRAELQTKLAPKQAKPMTKEILANLIQFLYSAPQSLRVWRTVWRLNLAFYGLLRWDDVKRLCVSDFRKETVAGETRYVFTLKGGKSLMYNKDQSRCLYPTRDPGSCPVILTERYFQFLGEWTGSVVPLCSAADRNKPNQTRVMSYTNAKEDLKFILELIGVDPAGFGEHSMKRGGATEAARRGASANLIQDAGDWSNSRIASLYVDHPRSRNQLLRDFLD